MGDTEAMRAPLPAERAVPADRAERRRAETARGQGLRRGRDPRPDDRDEAAEVGPAGPGLHQRRSTDASLVVRPVGREARR